jgi:hypothetical protein
MGVPDELIYQVGDAADPAGYLARIDRLQALVGTLQARVSELESPPEKWLPLKAGAADANVRYENARSWAEAGLIKSRKDGGRVIVELGSLVARRILFSGK